MPIRKECKDLYPPDWQQIRERILAREEHKCKWCGVHNYAVGHRKKDGRFQPVAGDILADALGSGKENYRVARQCATSYTDNDCEGIKYIVIVLTIAHLDHDPTQNKDHNLAALCQQCHNRHDAPTRAQGRRYRRKEQQPTFTL